MKIEEDIKALQQQRKRFADGRVPAYTTDTYMKIGALIDAYNLILKDNEQMAKIQNDLSKDIAELFNRLEKRTNKLIPKYIIELKLEELIKNQELTEQGILNRESIEEKEEIGAIKVLKEILETVEKGAEE